MVKAYIVILYNKIECDRILFFYIYIYTKIKPSLILFLYKIRLVVENIVLIIKAKSSLISC